MNSLIGSINENIGETAAIVTNDLNEWEQMRSNLSKTCLKGKVTLGVGRREFSTTVETFTREKISSSPRFSPDSGN